MICFRNSEILCGGAVACVENQHEGSEFRPHFLASVAVLNYVVFIIICVTDPFLALRSACVSFK